MFTESPSATWRALVGATLKRASVSPWEWLKEGQTFGVQIQETGEKIYCSVMGQVGGLKALAIYPGKMGWKSYVELGTLETDTPQRNDHAPTLHHGFICAGKCRGGG